MDTSTLTVTDIPEMEPSTPSLTSAHYSDRIQPGVEWLTRLIAPLTRHTADPSSPPIQAAIPASSAIPVTMESGTKKGSSGQAELMAGIIKQAASPLNQVPYPSQPQMPAPREPTGGSGNAGQGMNTMLLVFIPILAVLLTILLGLLVFLVSMLYMKRKRGIRYVGNGNRYGGHWLMKQVD